MEKEEREEYFEKLGIEPKKVEEHEAGETDVEVIDESEEDREKKEERREEELVRCDKNVLRSGSTAACVYCDHGSGAVVCMHLGDSRIIRVTQDNRIITSRDHTVAVEQKNVLHGGAFIQKEHSDHYVYYDHRRASYYQAQPQKISLSSVSHEMLEKSYTYPVHYSDNIFIVDGTPLWIASNDVVTLDEVNLKRHVGLIGIGGVQPSRAFGDYEIYTRDLTLKKLFGLSITPEVHISDIALSEHKAILLVTDGVYRALSTQSIVALVTQNKTADAAAWHVLEKAGAKTGDNKALIVILPQHSAS